MGMLNVSGMPSVLIVDQSGEPVFFHQGFKIGDEKVIRAEIEKLLAEQSK
jgi:hypothetical protein